MKLCFHYSGTEGMQSRKRLSFKNKISLFEYDDLELKLDIQGTRYDVALFFDNSQNQLN